MTITMTYDDMTIEHTPAAGWIDPEDGDAESRAAKNKITITRGAVNLAALEGLLELAAVRCVAADVRKMRITFGPQSDLEFSGRVVGAGTTCDWLDVKLRVERPKWGESLPVRHLVSALESYRADDHPVASRVLAFLRQIGDQPILDATVCAAAERRNKLAARAEAATLEWWLEDAAHAHGASVVRDD